MSELITYIKIILFYGKLLRGQEGRICIMRCHSATWGKYISNTSLATGRITLQTAYPPGFSTTTFIFLCAHRNAKSLYPSKTISLHLFFFVLPWWEFQLREIILLHSIVRTVKTGTSQQFRIGANCTPQEIGYVCVRYIVVAQRMCIAHISLMCLRYY